MAFSNVTDPLAYLGKTVLVELVWKDEPEPEPWWGVVRIVGVVLEDQPFWSEPYFMVFSYFQPQTHPDEMFLSDIRTIRVLDPFLWQKPRSVLIDRT